MAATVGIHTSGDRAHDVVVSDVGGVVLHLFLQIASVQPRQPGHADPVALALNAVTGEAGVGRAAAPAAQRDQFTSFGQRRIGLAGRKLAPREGGHDGDQQKARGRIHRQGTQADGSGSGNLEPQRFRRIGMAGGTMHHADWRRDET